MYAIRSYYDSIISLGSTLAGGYFGEMDVITSYSIHYTKLYESLLRLGIHGRQYDRPPEVPDFLLPLAACAQPFTGADRIERGRIRSVRPAQAHRNTQNARNNFV